jgi:hypothetical protein
MRCFLNRALCPICLFCFLLCLASACGGRSSDERSAVHNDATRTEAPKAKPSAASPSPFVSSADDEIVPLIAPVSPASAEDQTLPEDPSTFEKELLERLKTDPSPDVLPMIDTALVLNPGNLEIREARADILLEQGLKEDATADLLLCCKGGRASCCR